jgi:hypothetical protein
MSRQERVGPIRISAAELASRYAIEMVLTDGDGIGWTLAGVAFIPELGRVGLECPSDPLYEFCYAYVPADKVSTALDLVLRYFQRTAYDVITEFHDS